MLGVAEVDQGVEVIDRLEDNIAAPAAIAAVRTAKFDIFFPAEGDDTVTAIAGFHIDFGLVKKLHCLRSGRGAERARAMCVHDTREQGAVSYEKGAARMTAPFNSGNPVGIRRVPYSAASGRLCTETCTRPSARRSNFTCPSTRENRV